MEDDVYKRALYLFAENSHNSIKMCVCKAESEIVTNPAVFYKEMMQMFELNIYEARERALLIVLWKKFIKIFKIFVKNSLQIM